MRVLMVFCELLTGGAEVTAVELIRALQGRAVQFIVAAVRPGGELAQAVKQAGAVLYDGVARRRLDVLAPWRIAWIIRRHQVDALIVVDVARNALFYALAGAALSARQMPRLCWCNSRPDGQSGRFLWQLRAYRALRWLTGVVCTSRLQRQMLADGGLPRRRMPLIRNGVDLGRFANPPASDLPLPKGKHILVSVANVMPDKDHDTLLSAAARLAEKRSDFHLVLVGRDTDSPAFAEKLTRAGLARFVTPTGRRSDVPSLLAAADLFVLSTRREVFNVATVEAMAAGRPVITTDLPAFREMFSSGREGLKVPPGNADALAGAIGRLLDDAQLRTQMGEAARRRAQAFGLDRMASSFRRLLASLCARGART